MERNYLIIRDGVEYLIDLSGIFHFCHDFVGVGVSVKGHRPLDMENMEQNVQKLNVPFSLHPKSREFYL